MGFRPRNQCNLYEGSVVRVIRRLEELIRELATAAKTIGNEELAAQLGVTTATATASATAINQ